MQTLESDILDKILKSAEHIRTLTFFFSSKRKIWGAPEVCAVHQLSRRKVQQGWPCGWAGHVSARQPPGCAWTGL